MKVPQGAHSKLALETRLEVSTTRRSGAFEWIVLDLLAHLPP